MNNYRKTIPVLATGIIVTFFVAATLMSAQANEQGVEIPNFLQSPIPRPMVDQALEKGPVSVADVVPDEVRSVKITAKTDKAVYHRGDIADIQFSFENGGNKPFSATELEIEYEIIALDGGPGYSIVSYKMYAFDNPFTVNPGGEGTASIPWPLIVDDGRDATQDAKPGQYLVRTIVHDPVEIVDETIVEVAAQ